MKRTLLLCLLLAVLTGCTVRGGWPRFLRPGEAMGWHAPQDRAKLDTPHVAPDPELPALAAMAKQRDGTNYIGLYMGMIAEWDGNTSVYKPETDKNGQPVYGGTGKMVPNMKPQGVMMFSATSGELLKWISYDDFDAIFVRKVKPEYPSK